MTCHMPALGQMHWKRKIVPNLERLEGTGLGQIIKRVAICPNTSEPLVGRHRADKAEIDNLP